MNPARLISSGLAVAALVTFAFTGAAGAGQGPPELVGTVSCDAGTYTVTWTITVIGLPDGTEANLVDIELSGATSGTVEFSPNPVPGPSPASSQGTTTLPGSTTGDVTLSLVSDYVSQQDATATVSLDGTCVAPPAPPAPPPVVAQSPSFTG